MLLAARREIRYNTDEMTLTVFGSARVRRRAGWAVAIVAVSAAVAAAIVLLPSGGRTLPVVHGSGPTQFVRTPEAVPMTPTRRRAVDELLAQFIPAAVERKDPLRALPLVTPAFRSDVSRAAWARGDLPVFPYHARDKWGWILGYSHPRELSVDVLLHPARTEKLGAIAYTAVFVKRGDRWLIDSFVPAASFAPEKRSPPRILAQPDFSPWLDSRGDAALSKTWLALPAAVLGLVLLVPLAIGALHWRRSRRAWKRYERALSSR